MQRAQQGLSLTQLSWCKWDAHEEVYQRRKRESDQNQEPTDWQADGQTDVCFLWQLRWSFWETAVRPHLHNVAAALKSSFCFKQAEREMGRSWSSLFSRHVDPACGCTRWRVWLSSKWWQAIRRHRQTRFSSFKFGWFFTHLSSFCESEILQRCCYFYSVTLNLPRRVQTLTLLLDY